MSSTGWVQATPGQLQVLPVPEVAARGEDAVEDVDAGFAHSPPGAYRDDLRGSPGSAGLEAVPLAGLLAGRR